MAEKEMAAVVASNIQYYLDENHLTRKELAEKLGVSLSSVGFWCIGAKIPRMDKIDKMCSIFGCKRSDLLISPAAIAPAAADGSLSPADLTSPEREHIRKYRALDENGREMVDAVLDTAFQQVSGAASASLGDAM